MPTPVRLLTVEDHAALESDRRAGVKSGSHRFEDYFPPGTGWYCTWYHDPLGWARHGISMRMDRERGLAGLTFLSVHYWRDWSDKRPPILIVCPNGRQVCIDQKSNNGDGWIVRKIGGKLTVRPSIVVPGWHGWISDGVLSDDIEGRGPNGISL